MILIVLVRISVVSFAGGLFGGWAHYYLRTFATHLARDIYHTYIEIFPQNPPRFCPQAASIQPLTLPSRKMFIFCSTFMWFVYSLVFIEIEVALVFSFFVSILILIAWLDWSYYLISPTLCQGLFALGVCSSWLGISTLSLEQSLLSAVLFFSISYGIYYLSAFFYKKEAFGRGDCWLMLAIGSVVMWEDLPLLMLLACVSGLIFASRARLKGHKLTHIPFAPFLVFAAMVTFIINHL